MDAFERRNVRERRIAAAILSSATVV